MAEQPDRPKKRPTKAELLSHGPWLPPAYELADAAALQAVANGSANPEQQKRALKWVIEQGAGTYDMSYRPGAEEGRRDTDFAEGRRFVGNQIVKLLKISLAAMARKNPHADAGEHG